MDARGIMNERRGRGGFALPVAVFAMVIIGVLVTGGFYMARQETRIGLASQNAADAFYLAETGVYQTVSSWANGTMSAIGAWNVDTLTGSATNGNWSVTVMPMTTRLYFLQSTGTVTKGGPLWSGATRQVGMIVRVSSAEMEPPAALSTQGNLTVGGSSQINGNDTNPTSWGGMCGSGPGNKPGIMIDDTTNISYSGKNYTVAGNPAAQQDTTINTASLLDFGDYTWDDLTAMAQKVYPSTVTLTSFAPDSMLSGSAYVCRETTLSNWGNPDNPNAKCGSYFPIIWGRQTLRINANHSGQGILLVDGDLEVQGGFTFYGPVYVKGEFKTAGTGGHFNGGVIAANVDLNTSTVLGNAVVTFSSCAVERAILNNSALSRAKPLAQRSWVDLSNISY
jgi:hypothetical protein